uniref:Uncharacterized protein n=1 Tax=Strombidium inclinatum TaxID=197538 RepID=A0A7S3N001_9SPIT
MLRAPEHSTLAVVEVLPRFGRVHALWQFAFIQRRTYAVVPLAELLGCGGLGVALQVRHGLPHRREDLWQEEGSSLGLGVILTQARDDALPLLVEGLLPHGQVHASRVGLEETVFLLAGLG